MWRIGHLHPIAVTGKLTDDMFDQHFTYIGHRHFIAVTIGRFTLVRTFV